MSKHKEKTRSPLADWEVSLGGPEGTVTGWHHIPASRWKRTAPGWYTFTDEQGVVAEFPPGVVLSVVRKEPPEVVLPPDEKALAAVAARTVLASKRQNGDR
ncbi:MAG TPA: hypothetical protein VLW50_21870 [Streptosporangiaceae bacterium]|nr:hypothetical protein [Streptosporangiaceae bacterium]